MAEHPEIEDMTMQISKLPDQIHPDKVTTGSLVSIPDEKTWAIRAGDKRYFKFKTNELSKCETAIAGFGTKYKVTVDPTQCRKLPYPWHGKDPLPGSLCIFSEDEKVCCSILFGDGATFSLQVFVFQKGKEKKGEIKKLEKGTDHGVVFPTWRIGFKAEDERDGYEWVYEFPVKAKK